MHTRSKVTVVGSTNWDICLYLPSLPVPGETVAGGELKSNLGGKGANQAAAAHLAGADTAFISCLGDDSCGADIIAQLASLGLDTGGISRCADTPTGTACIFIDAQGENCIGLTAGANRELTPTAVDRHASLLQEAAVVLLQLEIPLETVSYTAALAHRQGQLVILNPAPAQPLPDALYSHITLLTPNRGELAVLTGMPTATTDQVQAAALSLLHKGVEAVVVTLGAEGALLVTAATRKHVPAATAEVVDTTAAGDCFNGYLAAHLARHGMDDIDSAIGTAVAAAAIAVSRPGAVASIPQLQELDGH